MPGQQVGRGPSAVWGSFETERGGVRYGLELRQEKDRRLSGTLYIGGMVFGIRGRQLVQAEGVYGFLLEPRDAQPVAHLTARIIAQRLVLNVDFDDVDGPGSTEGDGPSRLTFKRRIRG